MGVSMNVSGILTLAVVVILTATIQCTLAQQPQCGNLQYLNTTTNECVNISTSTDFGILFNQTSYTVVVDHTLALTGIPLIPFTVYFSESVTSTAFGAQFGTGSWTAALSGIGGVSTQYFHLELSHPFPNSFTPPLADSDTIAAASGDNAPVVGNYSYQLSATVLTQANPFSEAIPVSNSVIVNIMLIETPDPCQNSPCTNGGTCSSSGSQFTCTCPPEYTGQVCNVTVNPCDSDPCEHQGTCSQATGLAYTCSCSAGYTGPTCAEDIDDCVEVNCGNGTCVDLVNDYRCECNLGYTGTHCMTNIDDCASNPCVNGQCQDMIGGFNCACYPDWTGTLCDTDINACDSFPCDATGSLICNNQNGTYSCECRTGFTDQNCTININDCDPNPCLHSSTCIDGIALYTCQCSFGYTGTDCDTVVDFCEPGPCQNNGTCTSMEAVGYVCNCVSGYTDMNCSSDINECDTSPCFGNSTCSNKIGSFECLCPPDYTGTLCQTKMNDCVEEPCRNGGTCIDGINTFTCNCAPDFTGMACETRIDNCINNTHCVNGNCVDDINSFTCNCSFGYAGTLCDIDVSVCQEEAPCTNGGTCTDGVGALYNCSCAIGYTGVNCTTDVSVCDTEAPCSNGGTCSDGPGANYTCACTAGWGGTNCDIDLPVCTPTSCQNGGTCVEGLGPEFNCTCSPGFTGNVCQIDVVVCASEPCLNGGTCSEGIGLTFNCTCALGYGGPTCAEDRDVCTSTTCQNGGSCIEGSGIGPEFTCECLPGFDGDTCETDLPVCHTVPCQNGGTCSEGLGLAYNCSCSPGWAGVNCTEDQDVCSPTSCNNGGTCVEGVGAAFSCQCPPGYSGNRCQTDLQVCFTTPCQNGGTCSEGPGFNYTCSCSQGWSGVNCTNDLDVCTPASCSNGGTCVEGVGVSFSCECLPGFSGDRCQNDLPVCHTDPCRNGGTCSEGIGLAYTCFCQEGFNGTNCTNDLEYCTSSSCLNGGTCVEGLGTIITCECTVDFTGPQCNMEIILCEDNTCQNGGTCMELPGNDTICMCLSGYTGDMCEINVDACDPNPCENGGTCSDGDQGLEFTCSCVNGYAGPTCQIDLNFCMSGYCKNGGTCVEGPGTEISCNCTVEYTGDTCQDAFCTPGHCSNGGTCTASGSDHMCACPLGYEGVRCEIDQDGFCDSDSCGNGGTCIEGPGPNTSCNCPPDYTGDSCDQALCTPDYCYNGGTCSVSGSNLICACPDGFGYPLTRCETDLNHCMSGYCKNGGTCVEGYADNISCNCTSEYTGDTCQDAFCTPDYCFNGGTCTASGSNHTCACKLGYEGPRCEIDQDGFCDDDTCLNGGTCIEGPGPNTSCNCPSSYTGTQCGTLLVCSPNPCENGGTCTPAGGANYNCACIEGFSGDNCEVAPGNGTCRQDSDCPTNTFCQINCSSDYYPTHKALLTEAVTLSERSFINVYESRYPSFDGDFTLFSVFRQDDLNRGYLVFYGTSGDNRNFAVFLDNNSSDIFLYYASASGQSSVQLESSTSWQDGQVHYLAIRFTTLSNTTFFYLDGALLGAKSLIQPNFKAGITSSQPAALLVGARLPRSFTFSGRIHQVIFFESFLAPEVIQQLQQDFPSLVDPQGSCQPYLQMSDTCPTPRVAPSTLCVSSIEKCDPTLKCLPNFGASYTCKPDPVGCTVNSDCSSGYFCGSKLPLNASNYFQNPSANLPGENMYLQETPMALDGLSVVAVTARNHPNLASDLTIFAVVRQEPNNDGYLVGKGINDRMRDFGLYLRSSKRTVWLAYGSDEGGKGFRDILFFYDVSVADGKFHSVTAVVESSVSKATLYIDGEVVGTRTLPSTPQFRPGFNILYVGGRPLTRMFRFKGTIRNLFVSTAPLQSDSVMQLHNDSQDGQLSLEPPTSQYCYQYRTVGQQCLVSDSDTNDYRCSAGLLCIPDCGGVGRSLPTDTSYRPSGVCRAPCNCPDPTPGGEECGVDGCTYHSQCFRECAQVNKRADGTCTTLLAGTG